MATLRTRQLIFSYVLREANECERLRGESVGVEALDKFGKICQRDL